MQKALAMFRSIDDLQLKDLDAAANFSITSSWLSESLTVQGRNDEATAVGTEGISVASKVLDRNPTHMLALRGRALLASNLARLAGAAFRPAEAQALADDAARDWTMLLRVDPSNMIAWNNLGVARFGGHISLLAQGRVRAAMAKLEEVRVAEPMTAKSGMVAGMYSFNRNLLGGLAAELGDIQRANAYNADAERFFKISLNGISAGTFDHAYWSAVLEVWKAEVALSLGDFARTRSLADSARIQVERLKPEAEFSRQQQAELLRRLSFALGTAAEWTNDFASAEKHFRATVEYRKRTPVRNQIEQREAAVEVALHAAALARLGRLSEARQTIEPVVEQYRGYAARNKDNQAVKSEMAGVLYAAALANPEQGKALLDEARGLFNSLPPELREMRSVAHVGDRIAEAKGR
jgi:tetratricopeptide (TPR) repeat protein